MPLFRHRLAALLAIIAMVLQGLLPLTAHAVAQAGDGGLFDTICSAEGGKSPAPGSTHGQHCALCVAAGDRTAVLPNASFANSPAECLAHATPAGESPAGHSGPLYSPAHARAPPVQS